MYANGQAVVALLEELAPKRIAEEGDKIGLQVGSLQKEITCALITLDVTPEVVEEAIRIGANLIIAHHAVIFRPLQQLITDTPMGRLYESLIKHDIAVYISHTNLDIAEGGLNDWLAEALQLQQTSVLKETHSEPLGLGRVGYLETAQSLGAFAETVKAALHVPFVRVSGDLNRQVRKVAVLGGSGSKFVGSAIFKGADVYVTGDIDFHSAQDALMAGLSLIDPGHHAEKIMKRKVADWLVERLSRKKSQTAIMVSQVDTDPFRFV